MVSPPASSAFWLRCARLGKRRPLIRQITRVSKLAVVLAATAFGAAAQDGDVAVGHAFAREACVLCHTVEAERRLREDTHHRSGVPRRCEHRRDDGDGSSGIPDDPHPRMPKLILTPEQSADVIAYILSLRDRR